MDLSKVEILKKCLHGKTQNPNESVVHIEKTYIPQKRGFLSIVLPSLITIMKTFTKNIFFTMS